MGSRTTAKLERQKRFLAHFIPYIPIDLHSIISFHAFHAEHNMADAKFC